MASIRQQFSRVVSSVVNLAQDKPPASFKREIGVRKSSNSLLDSYKDEESRIDDISISEYRAMRKNDGKVASLVNLYKLPVISTEYDILPSSGDTGEAEFIKSNLLEPFQNGGMSMPMRSIIEDMVYAMFEGFRAYEKVWYVHDGQIRLRKLAPRDSTITEILSDDKGGFAGLRQQVGNKKVKIPAEKSLLVVYNQVEDPYYGESILKPAWYHWDKKHKLYYISYVAAEVQTVPPRVLKDKGLSEDQRKALEDALDTLGLESRITFDGELAEIEFMDIGSGRKVDIKDLIDHHDSQMSKALVAQWIDLSSEGGSSGSRALAEPMMDIYLKSVANVTKLIEESFNHFVIPQLINWNFQTRSYPKFMFHTVKRQTADLIREAFVEMVKSGKTPRDFDFSVIENVAQEIGVEFDAEQEIEKEDANREEEQKQQQTPQMQPVVIDHTDHKKAKRLTSIELAEEFGDTRMDLQDIANRIPRTQRELVRRLTAVLDSVSPRLRDDLKKAIQDKDYVAIREIAVGRRGEYTTAMQETLNDIYNYSKNKVSEEMDIATPVTTEEAKERISTKSEQVTKKQYEDLAFVLISVGLAAIDAGWDRNQIDAAIETELSRFITEKIEAGSDVLIMDVFNRARQDVMEQNSQILRAYKFTNAIENILRGAVCPYCESLNGMVVEVDDDAFHKYHPPLHHRCACTWEPVMITDDDRITGAPSSLPVYDTIGSFRQIDKSRVNEARAEMGLPSVSLNDDPEYLVDLAEQESYITESDIISYDERELANLKYQIQQYKKDGQKGES